MSHGEELAGQHSTSSEAISGGGNSRAQVTPENVFSGASAGSSSTVPENVDPISQTEKDRIFKRVEQAMDCFRKDEISSFRASICVLEELGKWTGVADEDRVRAYNSYLAEINSPAAARTIPEPGENQVATSGTSVTSPTPRASHLSIGSPHKRGRDEVDDLLERVSRGEPEEEENECRMVRRKYREDEMPWYNPNTISTRRSSCIETCKSLHQFSEDPTGVRAHLRIANDLPEGIPNSQWEKLLRGEALDLNQILSAMHFVQIDEERKGHLGSSEVVFAVAESKRQVKTGAEWTSAFRRASNATTFIFPHRSKELIEYADHIESLFSAKYTGAHSKVILYDQSVRNLVGGGQNILLTDFQRFLGLREAIFHADGVEYLQPGGGNRKGGPPKPGDGSEKPGGGNKKDLCKRFNGTKGCKFLEADCYYRHICRGCGKGGHGESTCTNEKQ